MSGRISKVITTLLLSLLGPVVYAAGTVTYVYTDPQGTPLAEADASGTITTTFDYKPYGSQVLGTPEAAPGYTGHVNDPDTGFVYMQARYYDPAVGRFLSVDPVSPKGGGVFNFGRFTYANNSPYVNQDLTGKSCVKSGKTFTCQPTIDGKPITYLPKTPPLPAPSNWPDKMDSSSRWYHSYIYDTPIGNKTEASVASAIAGDPVPNKNGLPGSPQGTSNDATPSTGFRSTLANLTAAVGLGDAMVTTYTFKDSKGATWTMNVTQDSHTLSPGYVLRGVVDGSVITYGEGTAFKQALGQASDALINDVWINQNQQNIDEAH